MLIRSQDKQKLVSMDGITYLEIVSTDSCAEIWAWSVHNYDVDIILGRYGTQEKTEAVMDDIQLSYNTVKQAETAGELIGINGFTYQMPDDDDPAINARINNTCEG